MQNFLKKYIGETGHTIKTQVKEHMCALKNRYPEKSAVADQSLQDSHQIDFENITVLDRTQNYSQRLVREAIEIFKEPNNINRDVGLKLHRTWKTNIQKKDRESQSGDSEGGSSVI
jgi:hypothetical protein